MIGCTILGFSDLWVCLKLTKWLSVKFVRLIIFLMDINLTLMIRMK